MSFLHDFPIGLPGFEVVHVYQDAGTSESTILLLHRTAGEGAEYLIAKQINRRENKNVCWGDETLSNEEDVLMNLLPWHPNIIMPLSKHFNVPREGFNTLLLEWAQGEDLGSLAYSAWTNGKYIDEPLLWHILIGVIMALRHLGRNNIIHRDTHIGNVFLKAPLEAGGFPQVCLADFEWADREFVSVRSKERDFTMFGESFRSKILHVAQEPTADGGSTTPYSMALRYFVDRMVQGSHFGDRVPHQSIETEGALAFAREMLQQSGPPRLSEWVTKYFGDLKNSRTKLGSFGSQDPAVGSSPLTPIVID